MGAITLSDKAFADPKKYRQVPCRTCHAGEGEHCIPRRGAVVGHVHVCRVTDTETLGRG